ncbi:hypothetical protein K440DRAFT_660248 [Wilcoxina mikolae CBS 423.85]|nr:hypothetical protein K440DRAFT_660248 [Wilcoxina mikolae CBS 423.85]
MHHASLDRKTSVEGPTYPQARARVSQAPFVSSGKGMEHEHRRACRRLSGPQLINHFFVSTLYSHTPHKPLANFNIPLLRTHSFEVPIMDRLPADIIYEITLHLIMQNPSPKHLYNFLAANPTALTLFRRYGSNLLLKKFDSVLDAITINDLEFHSCDCDNMDEWDGLFVEMSSWTQFALKFHNSCGTKFPREMIGESVMVKIEFPVSRLRIRESMDGEKKRKEASRLALPKVEREKGLDGDKEFARRFLGLSTLRSGKTRIQTGGKKLGRRIGS